jgi:hypothetical protein
VSENITGTDAEQRAVARLDALAADLAGRGFLTESVNEAGAVRLQVANQDAPGCCEDITVAADDNGSWWFLWSWGDRIALVTDIAAAAFKIAYVLTPLAG